jgi:hypothetical protein
VNVRNGALSVSVVQRNLSRHWLPNHVAILGFGFATAASEASVKIMGHFEKNCALLARC